MADVLQAACDHLGVDRADVIHQRVDVEAGELIVVVRQGMKYRVPLDALDAPEASQEAAETVQIDVDATDAAIRLANEEGVELAFVEGTGSGGRITKTDVVQYISYSRSGM